MGPHLPGDCLLRTFRSQHLYLGAAQDSPVLSAVEGKLDVMRLPPSFCSPGVIFFFCSLSLLCIFDFNFVNVVKLYMNICTPQCPTTLGTLVVFFYLCTTF